MIDVINVLTIVNLALLAIFMGVRKVNTNINQIFALIIFTPATDFIINYLVYKGWIYHVPYLVFLNFSFLWSPLLMWYIRLMLGYRDPITFRSLLHLTPQMLSWIFWLYAFAQGREYVDNIFRERAAYNYPPAIAFFQIVVLSQIFGYTIYGALLVNKHKKDTGSSITEGKIRWLRQFVNLLVTLGILSIICAILFSNADNDYIFVPLLYMVVYFMIVRSSFRSFGVFPDSSHNIHVREEVIQHQRQPLSKSPTILTKPALKTVDVDANATVNADANATVNPDANAAVNVQVNADAATPVSDEVNANVNPLADIRKQNAGGGSEKASAQKTPYENSVLRPELISSYKDRLTAFLAIHEPYTDPNLTLTSLSGMLNIPSHHLSQTINQAMQKNFADLVNSYRVEKSKQLLIDPATSMLTLDAIGMQSGFGSSSAFYRAFRKFTGLTPKDFLKSKNTES